MPSGQRTVLVVDDDPVMTKLLSKFLGRGGFNVHEAHSGQEAVSLAEKLAPDLIVMDVTMPDMDGYESTERIRRLPGLESTPVLFISGQRPSEDAGRSFAAGGAAYLTKPFAPQQLVDIATLALEAARTKT